ncbi:MAG: hypothetical protein V3S29_08575 [bacterium]
MKSYQTLCAIVLAGAILALPALATGQQAGIEQLKEEIRALRVEIGDLKASLETLQRFKPTFATFMPEFAERFHVMHRAADARDWMVAAHELAEMKRLVSQAKFIDPGRGALLQGFMAGHLETIQGTIDHAGYPKFLKALAATVVSCNKCHVASGSGFVEVTLAVEDNLSIRHPHRFSKTKATKHAH